eukprot:TRINITY_DN5599_c0_g1_i1.p1 TRINITY_DN5599_c0_g1~~TRINITY_DN5599_c0_g1_i1.p1  ORF type:complete len:136 (-),score=4.93 TRINITY_DN5599_c0_g1_i1:135-542(-)
MLFSSSGLRVASGSRPLPALFLHATPAGRPPVHGLVTVLREVSPPPQGTRRKRGVVTAGLPVVSGIPIIGPLVNLALSPVVLFAAYAICAARFWAGFNRTTYSDAPATKVTVTALWPVLFVASKAFRDNFKKAVK